MAGFPVPILHGLCTYGYATRHIQNQFPDEEIVGVKGRFSSPVLPGQTLITKMWNDGDKCLYEGNYDWAMLTVCNRQLLNTTGL